MRKKVILPVFLCLCLSGYSQFPLTGVYNQDFNSLVSAGTGSGLPSGWIMLENGSAADALYSAGTGSGSTGDTYSFGSISAADRALGTLLSGTLQSTTGFYFTNNTGTTITRLAVTYTGEQWRLGAISRNDRLDFQFSLNAASLSNGDWVDFDQLDFTAPVSSSPTGGLDGNNNNNRRQVTAIITGIFISSGSTCFFRWLDTDATGADDGLAIDDLIIEPGFVVPSAYHYRSTQSGNWSSLNCWEMSADEVNWTPATEIPTWYTNSIRIRTGHTITHQYFAVVDQLVIESGGLFQHSGGQLSLNDGSGDDLQVNNAGSCQLAIAGNLPVLGSPGATIRIKTGGILRISAGGLSTVPGAGIHAAAYVYEHGSIIENAYNGMGANGVTYFPNVTNNTIPILRITQPITLPVGATAATRVNGILEVNGNLSFTASGQKIFRNGIRGSATLSTTATSGMVVIDGATAVLGGTGSLNLSASVGLQLGSNTTVTLEQDKIINGQLTLGAASSYVDVGANTLTVTGLVNGGGASSYIHTPGNGLLRLEGVDLAGKLFPVGHSRYNPVLIEKGSGLRWSVRVNDGITPDFPYTDQGAVLLTWHIRPDVTPPVTPADISFRFDQQMQTGSLFNTNPYSNETVQAWQRSNAYWLSAGTPQPLVSAGGDIRTVKISGLTAFDDLGLSRMSLPLPVKLISFEAIPLSNGHTSLQWKIAAPAAIRFIPEYSDDGLLFIAMDTIAAGDRTAFEFTAKYPLNSVSYFRLKIMDTDGSVSYSTIVKKENPFSNELLVRLIENPVLQELFLQVSSTNHQPALWEVMDATGKRIVRRQVWIVNGTKIYQLPLPGLPGGIYYFHISGQGWQRLLRFVKQ
jgi:hypothetical protein